jgi:phosphoribosylformylglycinamidine synthase
MPRFEAHIDISHLAGVADPAGATVERALPALGYANVTELKIAKSIRLVLDCESAAAAEAQVVEMCERVLANPVIENYAVRVTELSELSGA